MSFDDQEHDEQYSSDGYELSIIVDQQIEKYKAVSAIYGNQEPNIKLSITSAEKPIARAHSEIALNQTSEKGLLGPLIDEVMGFQ